MKKLTKEEQIAESIKRFQERFTFGGLVGVVTFRESDPSAWEVSNFLKQELEAIVEKTREETERDTKMWWMQSIVDNLGYVLLEGHGGGNWRRLVTILQEDFEKMLANLSDKESK